MGRVSFATHCLLRALFREHVGYMILIAFLIIPLTRSLFMFLSGYTLIDVLERVHEWILHFVLFCLFILAWGFYSYSPKAHIPIVISSNGHDFEKLKNAMKKAGYKPWNIGEMRKVLGSVSFDEEKFSTIVIDRGRIRDNDELRERVQEVKRKVLFIAKEIAGHSLVGSKFHVFFMTDVPVSLSFITGRIFGNEHIPFSIYAEEIKKRGDIEHLRQVISIEDLNSTPEPCEFLLRCNGSELKTQLVEGEIEEIAKNIRSEKVLIFINFTPTVEDRDALSSFSRKYGHEIVEIELPEKEYIPIEKMRKISIHTKNITRFIGHLISRGVDITLALKIPHPISFSLGYNLRYQNLKITHYHRDFESGERYFEPVSLHELLK